MCAMGFDSRLSLRSFWLSPGSDRRGCGRDCFYKGVLLTQGELRFEGRGWYFSPVNSPVLRDPQQRFLSHLQAYFRQHP